MDKIQIREDDLAVFMLYAEHERTLDRDAAIYRVHGATEHLKAVEALRQLNYRMLLRDTRHV